MSPAGRAVRLSDGYYKNDHKTTEPPDPGNPPPATTVPLWENPYRVESVWKQSLKAGVTYEAATDTRTANYQSVSGTINVGNVWNVAVWETTGTDPLYPVMAASNTATVYGQFRVPSNWFIPGPDAPAERDGWVTIVNPDGRTAFGFYKMTAVRNVSGVLTGFTVTRPPWRTDFTGDGIVADTGGTPTGPTAINAAASSWAGRASTLDWMPGAIRRWDVLNGRGRHTLLLSCPDSVLYYDPVTGRGWVWPARWHDTNAPTHYKGWVPMGARLGLLPSINLTQLGITDEDGIGLARDLIEFGAVVGDRSSSNVLTAERPDPTHPRYSEWVARLDRKRRAWSILTRHMRIITGSTPNAPGGPGAEQWPNGPAGTLVPLA